MKQQLIPYEAKDLRLSFGNFLKPDLNGYNKPALHSHNNRCELLCIFRGKGTVHVEGTCYPITDGCFMLARPGESHYMTLDPSHPYERTAIHFAPDILDSIDPERRLLAPFFNREPGSRSHYQHTSTESRALVRQMLEAPERLNIILCLIRLLQYFGELFTREEHTQVQETPEHKIIRYINEHPQEDFTTESLCSRFYISRTQLYRRFKKATGTSVGEYINASRVRMAQSLIHQGQKPTQVYSQCGFQDYSTFFRAYRKHIGHSPNKPEP